MKSKYLALTLSAVALVACNNEDVLEVNQGRGISFQVATEASTRATATTTSTIQAFNVWGFTTDEEDAPLTLMNGINVSKSNNEWTYTDPIFWPINPVDFYSIAPVPVSGKVSGGTVSITNETQTISNFTVDEAQDKQVDLLYAVNKGEKKDNHKASAVNINFRHALSQIVFKAKNTNDHLKVIIRGVRIGNIKKVGDFTYPSSSTTPQNESQTGTITPSTQGEWGNVEAAVTFKAGITQKELNGKIDEAVDLTTKDTEGKAYTGALFMIPQLLTAWNPKTHGALATDNTGAYFLVDCRMLTGENRDALAWPAVGEDPDGDGFAEVAIPVNAITWGQGKKYVYTFVFGDGGGYIPGPDPDPDPAVYGIGFTVTVDEFINGFAPDDDKEVDVETGKEQPTTGA